MRHLDNIVRGISFFAHEICFPTKFQLKGNVRVAVVVGFVDVVGVVVAVEVVVVVGLVVVVGVGLVVVGVVVVPAVVPKSA